MLASKATAVKTRHLDTGDPCSLALDLGTMHVTVDARPVRLTGQHDVERATAAFLDVYSWPTTVAGDELDAPYAAPSSGGPPFRVYELTPTRAFAVPTNDQFEPTRFVFCAETRHRCWFRVRAPGGTARRTPRNSPNLLGSMPRPCPTGHWTMSFALHSLSSYAQLA